MEEARRSYERKRQKEYIRGADAFECGPMRDLPNNKSG